MKKILKSKVFRIIVIVIILFVIGNIFLQKFLGKKELLDKVKNVNTVKPSIKTIEASLSTTGIVEPLHKYDITSLVEGEIISSDFKEGDYVKKNQLLYEISTDKINSDVKSANNSITRAEYNLDKAREKSEKLKKEYFELKDKKYDLDINSKFEGSVSEVLVKKGDRIGYGTSLFKINDIKNRELVIPFIATEISESLEGNYIDVNLVQTDEKITGKIIKVDKNTTTLSGNRVIKNIYIKVNSERIPNVAQGYVTINGIDSDYVSFSPIKEEIILADKDGVVDKVYFEKGDYIVKENVVVSLSRKEEEKKNEDKLKAYKENYENSLENIKQAENSLEDMRLNYNNQKDKLDYYKIKSPIEGTIISKNFVTGDKVAINSQKPLATIFDMSKLTYTMKVDELDIYSVKVGQEVEINSKILKDKKVYGKITNINLNAETQNNVSYYPVKVEIDKYDKLLPGMNITGKIVSSRVENALVVPLSCVMNETYLYVKDLNAKQEDPAVPAGFKKVKCEFGINDNEYVEVKSGITKDDEIYQEYGEYMNDMIMN